MMDVVLYNTLSRSKERFVPLKPGKAGIYTCGPTVYGRAHIGNLRAYIFADTLCKVLRYNDFKVKQIINITDVGHLVSDADDGEDKMDVAVRIEHISPQEIAQKYTDLYVQDCNRLRITPPTMYVKATDLIAEMISYVTELVDKGFAYEISDGIYYDIEKYPDYGCLSKLDLENQQAGARVEVNPEKRNPYDFAIWKKAAPEHLQQWDSPWGKGYPGWHIECSAISLKYLGERFDIHTGGVDHIPIHHENEIAQSYGHSGQIPADYWMHSEFIQIDKGKMSKSLGNVYSLDDLMERGYEPAAYRYMCLNAHYRKQLNFTWDGIKAAQTAINRLRAAVYKRTQAQSPAISEAVMNQYRNDFKEAINDDLNIPKAMSVVWDLARSSHSGQDVEGLFMEFDQVLALGLLEYEPEAETIRLSEEQEQLIAERLQARQERNWKRADEIRDLFNAQGLELIDTPNGTDVKKK